MGKGLLELRVLSSIWRPYGVGWRNLREGFARAEDTFSTLRPCEVGRRNLGPGQGLTRAEGTFSTLRPCEFSW